MNSYRLSGIAVSTAMALAIAASPIHAQSTTTGTANGVRGDNVSAGTYGTGTSAHLAGELFKHMAGVNLTTVPYNRAQESMAYDPVRHLTVMFGGEYLGEKAAEGTRARNAVPGFINAVQQILGGRVARDRDQKILLRSLALRRAAQALAYYEGRDYCIPDDIKRLVLPVLAHRVIVSSKYSSPHKRSDEAEAILAEILRNIEVPL